MGTSRFYGPSLSWPLACKVLKKEKINFELTSGCSYIQFGECQHKSSNPSHHVGDDRRLVTEEWVRIGPEMTNLAFRGCSADNVQAMRGTPTQRLSRREVNL